MNHKNVQKEFLELFPIENSSNSSTSSQYSVANVSSPIRTNLSEVMNSPQPINAAGAQYGHWTNSNKQAIANVLNRRPQQVPQSRQQQPQQPQRPQPIMNRSQPPMLNNNHIKTEKEKFVPTKQAIKNTYKKIILAIVISIIGTFIYSALAYSFTDDISTKFGLVLFADDGQPKLPVIMIHAFLFFLLIYLIFSIAKIN